MIAALIALLIYVLMVGLMFAIAWGINWRMRAERACMELENLLREHERIRS